jgi:hypothetical protein
MLTVIDFYAENPIENKIIASSNRFRTIENEDGYDLILTQTDPTKELKILGNNQPITMQVNGDEIVTIKNELKSIIIGKDSEVAPYDTIEINSDEFIDVKAGQRLNIKSFNEEVNIKGNIVNISSNYTTSVEPIFTLISDLVSSSQKLELRRSNNGRIELRPSGGNLRFGAYGGESIEFFMVGSGKVVLPNASNVSIQGGTTNQVLTTDGLGNLSWTTPSSGGLSASSFVYNEVPSGTVIVNEYTLAFTPVTNTVQVFLNGLLQKPTTDYTVSGTTITFINYPLPTDEILCHYIKA